MMKRTVIIIIGIALCIMIAGVISSSAQNIDTERMDRDLKVASNVLKSMVNQGNDFFRMGGRNDIEAEYVEGYGVIFTLPSRGMVFMPSPSRSRVVVRSDEARSEADQLRREALKDRKERADWEDATVKVAPPAEILELGESSENTIETIKTFLVDYTNLIGQLKSSDKVMVKMKNNMNFDFQVFVEDGDMVFGDQGSFGRLSAEIEVSDINNYRSGKISRVDALEKVVVTKNEPEEVEEDLRLFSNILKTVYESGISKTYFMTSRPGVERLKDFGVIYHAKVYSSNPRGFGENRQHDMPTLGLNDISQDERDNKVKELYMPFIETLKDNLVEYGRTIRSLKGDESIVLKTRLTSCEECGIPESVELTIKASVLKEYGSGKINKNSAVGKITVKESGKQ